MTGRISRTAAFAALIAYSGLSAVMYRRLHDDWDAAMIVIIIGVGVSLAVVCSYIARSEPPK